MYELTRTWFTDCSSDSYECHIFNMTLMGSSPCGVEAIRFSRIPIFVPIQVEQTYLPVSVRQSVQLNEHGRVMEGRT